MIIIYYSNRLECLKELLIELISHQKLDNPLHSEVILSENMAMIEWLYVKLAEYFSVSANIEFFSHFNFIWNILIKSLWGIFPKSGISHSTMSWTLMKILSNIDNDIIHDCSIIKKYLHDDINSYKCWQLSEKLKTLFIRYYIYHQEWLFQWQQEKLINRLDISTQSWQSEVWRLFLKEINNNQNGIPFFFPKNSIYKYIINFFKNNNVNYNKLPKRILIYGLSYFSPVLLEILQALGKYINVYIFCINPCRFFLKKNLNSNAISRIVQKRIQPFQCFSNIQLLEDIFNRRYSLFYQGKVMYNKSGNFLLSSWGKRFQDIFYSLLQLENIYENNIFIENVNDFSLLHMLQNDILNDYSQTNYFENTDVSIKNNNININNKNRLLNSDDDSLSVHVCRNMQREVEVLHDRLLGMISDDPQLLPHEIIVMAPNIDCYSSMIRSIFTSSSHYGRYLPFTIFGSSINNTNVVMSSFLKLLNLSYIRCSIEEILELLSVPPLALRFNIDTDGVKLLSTWILESGICWGLDDDVYPDATMSTGSNAQHTWKFGITRMLLSYAIDSTSGLWNKILPYDIGDSTSLMDLIGQLSDFLVKLKYWRNRLLKIDILGEWLSLAEEIIHDFYIADYDIETELTLVEIKYHWRQIISSGMQVNYHNSISINVLYNKLHDKLYKKKIKHRFYSGGIVFCNLSSARSIPFKVVCLLGMNVNAYPIDNKVPLNFDLMKHEVYYDDVYGWYNDRYLFLEVLLSARQRLYISFVGDSIPDHIHFVSSILINELFEYIIHNFLYLEKSTKRVSRITMHWIYHTLCYWHTSVPFSLNNYIVGSRYQTFFKEWLPTLHKNNSSYYGKFLSSLPLIHSDIISFDNLRNFYCHPIRAWFQNRLKIYIPKILEFPIDEPFSVKTRIKYRICEDLIFAFLNKKNINILYDQFRYSGIMPYGNFGSIFWEKQCEAMMKFSQKIRGYYSPIERSDLQFSLTLNNNIQLHGMLNAVQKNGLLRWRPGMLSMRDGLLLWLEHLIYCASGGKGDTWMFGTNNFWHFIPLSRLEAKEYLLFLISGYFHGLSTPLLLFSHSGGFWLQHSFDIKKQSISLDFKRQLEAREKLIAAWEGNHYIHGDHADPYVNRLIPKLRDQDIESIIVSSKKYFLFPMKFNVWN